MSNKRQVECAITKTQRVELALWPGTLATDDPWSECRRQLALSFLQADGDKFADCLIEVRAVLIWQPGSRHLTPETDR